MLRTLHICQAGPSRFEVRDDAGAVMGVAPDEAKAVTSAMFSADRIGEQGHHVRVLAGCENGGEEVYAVRRRF
ncbi:MAG TPA: hypothetical protein VGM26_16230 [Rhizomicrobium sp.]|jgi:hypothetical protein